MWAMTTIRLKEWRERRDLSLRALGARAGVAWSSLHRIEQGTLSPTLSMLEKLGRALDCDVHDLLPARRRRRAR